MARLRRRYRHPFLTETIEVNDNRVLNGMVVTFLYSAPKIYDPKPNVFVLNYTKDLLYGINLNYLPTSQVNDLIRRVIPLASPVTENRVQANSRYGRFEMSSRYTPSAVDGKFLWDRVKINQRIKEAHRTYKRNNMTAVEIRNIDFTQLGVVPDEN